MEADLPVIPCYDGKCDIYNCGDNSGALFCPGNSNTSLNCPSDTSEGICWGKNSNFCNGISVFCDPNVYNCSSKVNPAQNYLGKLLGCDVTKDPNCLEFSNDNDSISKCQDSCWKFGGQKEIDFKCNDLFKDKDSCNAMRYFCKWDNISSKCGAITDSIQAQTTDPLEINFKKYGNYNSSYSVEIKKDCPSTSDEFCTELSVPDNELWTLNCAQSSWSSTQKTSYLTDSHTCCLNKCNKDTKICTKDCLTTPRCQFVENSCECGFKKVGDHQIFMCSDNINNVNIGYCTWCKGTMDKEPYSNNNYLTRDKIEWFDSNNKCTNRCSEYNSCEVKDSEKLWNQCIWEESGGTLGINPTTSSKFDKGFCNSCEGESNEVCTKKNNILKICENKLKYLGNIGNKDNVLNPASGNIELPGTINYNWKHYCNDNESRNYLCTWCPSIQESLGTDSSNSFFTSFSMQQKVGFGFLIGFLVLVLIGLIVGFLKIIKIF